jgi:hypothetical protein
VLRIEIRKKIKGTKNGLYGSGTYVYACKQHEKVAREVANNSDG